MKKTFDIYLDVPGIGERKTTTKRATKEEAMLKALAAYPGAKVTKVSQIVPTPPRVRNRNRFGDKRSAKQASEETSRRKVEAGMKAMLKAIPPEGAGTTELAKAVGVTPASIREWTRKMEAQGLLTREPGARGRFTIKRVEVTA